MAGGLLAPPGLLPFGRAASPAAPTTGGFRGLPGVAGLAWRSFGSVTTAPGATGGFRGLPGVAGLAWRSIAASVAGPPPQPLPPSGAPGGMMGNTLVRRRPKPKPDDDELLAILLLVNWR